MRLVAGGGPTHGLFVYIGWLHYGDLRSIRFEGTETEGTSLVSVQELALSPVSLTAGTTCS